jgi:hypothetical protein
MATGPKIGALMVALAALTAAPAPAADPRLKLWLWECQIAPFYEEDYTPRGRAKRGCVLRRRFENRWSFEEIAAEEGENNVPGFNGYPLMCDSRTPHELKMMGEHPDCIYFEEMPLPRPRPK